MDEGLNSNFFQDLSLDSLANNLFLSGIGLWRLKLKGDNVEKAQVAVNQSFLSLLGDRRPQNLGLTPVTIRQFLETWLHPEEFGFFLKGLDALLQGQIDHLEMEFRLFSHWLGQWRWFSLHCDIGEGAAAEASAAAENGTENSPGTGSEAETNNQFIVVDGVVQDIHNNHLTRLALVEALSEKDQASKALDLERKRLALVIEAAELGAWDCDIQTGQVTYSPLLSKTIGLEPAELGHTLADRKNFVLPQDLAKADQALIDHCQGLTPMYMTEYRLKLQDGSVVWAQDRGRVVESDEAGRPKRLLGVMINVTRQKRVERDLSDNQEKMELFFRAASIGAWDLDLVSGRITYNDIFYDLLGYQRGELEETLAEWDSLIHPDDLPAVTAGMEMVINGQTIVYATETRLRHKKGHYVWTYDVARVAKWDARGQAIRLLGGHMDFTQQKRMEQDIYKMIELERDSRRAKELAEESARAKSEFLANMSHEIRTPMNAILGLTHLTSQTDLSDQQAEYLQRISAAAQSLLRIINDILDFSKIEAGKLEMEMTEFKLETLINGNFKLLGAQAQAKGLDFSWSATKDTPGFFLGDQVRLSQILNNLLSNAIKFTEKGGVSLKVSLAGREGDEATLEFVVQDSGIGLSTEQMGALFNAFSQADTSITRKYGGTGLGLTISKRLTELMGGQIWCESVLGEGSRFIFTIKLKVVEPKELENNGQVSFKGLSALVIDDDKTSLEILSEELRRKDFEVITCGGGQEAINYLENHPSLPDLVVVDWRMPDLDGLDTVRILREKWGSLRQVPIIMVTAFNRDEVLPVSRSLGVRKVLDKPISASRLHNSLMEFFGRRLARESRGAMDAAKEMIKDALGARILLVEDNDVNQLVAGRILGNAGFNVSIASNGRVAVDMIKSEEPYDLVLMDIQMPVMDGFTATRLIREMGHDSLPIVAMTAHAMSSDRELSLKAGMCDHINKPINVQELFRTLAKWIQPKKKS
ncbi:MAG: response regulator [Deltaproteobacteria bacterium]|jgi:PAS domain S-box-containing protein|nr:response regulator [Deltaproteobacteria bacterium]